MERSYTFMIGVFIALGVLSWWSESSVSARKWPAVQETSGKVHEDSTAKIMAPNDTALAPVTAGKREPAVSRMPQPLEIESLDP